MGIRFRPPCCDMQKNIQFVIELCAFFLLLCFRNSSFFFELEFFMSNGEFSAFLTLINDHHTHFIFPVMCKWLMIFFSLLPQGMHLIYVWMIFISRNGINKNPIFFTAFHIFWLSCFFIYIIWCLHESSITRRYFFFSNDFSIGWETFCSSIEIST